MALRPERNSLMRRFRLLWTALLALASLAAAPAALASTGSSGAFMRRQYSVINGTASTLSGKQILKLASNSHIAAILQDVKLKATGSNLQIWPQVSQVAPFW